MPTRLIIKNLPKYMTQERFKSHFESHGQITDAQLVKTKDGIFRRFGFIGYKNESEAEKAVEYFHNTFIDTCRISVEMAKSIQDPTLSRPWSRYSQGSSAYDKTHSKTTHASKKECTLPSQEELDTKKKEELLRYLYADESDDKLQEFLAVMRPRKSGMARTWANDDVLMARQKNSKSLPSDVSEKPTDTPDKHPDEYQDEYQDLPLHLDPESVQETLEIQKHFEKDATEELEEERDIPSDSMAFNETVSDMDYLRSKMPLKNPSDSHVSQTGIHPSRMELLQHVQEFQNLPVHAPSTHSLMSKETKESQKTLEDAHERIQSSIQNSIQNPTQTHEKEQTPVQLIGETGRLFIKNLPFDVEQADLESLFSKFGPLTEVHIPIFKDTKLQKGFAFVQFMLPEHAVVAYADCDGTIFQGRILEISPGKEKISVSLTQESGQESSFKSKKETDLKKSAGNDYNWNSLFMNSDAVAEAMAKKLGVKKGDILNHESKSSLAVKLALAETNIIQETKEYLQEQGVSLEAFQASRKEGKSCTVILVKNLPASASEEEIKDMFEKFGSLGRVLVPPSNTLALVEFLQVNEAKSAFNNLAYSKYKSLPLYLEWAPRNVFVQAFDPEKHASTKTILQGSDVLESETELEECIGSSLFVKNLNFSTTESSLESTFQVCPGLRSVRIPTKLDKNGTKLSLGYGFLEFQSKEQALDCLKTMQNTKLDGHVLSLKVSNAALSSTANTKNLKRKSAMDKNKKSTKLIVRNIPFEATKKDIQQLFSSFGMIKSVRLPTKFDGRHRGFGFVDFLTRQEALNAFESLGATHLYGRHLVLEWAQDEEEGEGKRKTLKLYDE